MNSTGLLAAMLIAGAACLAAGCTPDHRAADIRTCQAGAATAPGDSGASAEENHDAIGAQIADCMKGLGYRHDMADGKCVDDVDFNLYCYVRRRNAG